MKPETAGSDELLEFGKRIFPHGDVLSIMDYRITWLLTVITSQETIFSNNFAKDYFLCTPSINFLRLKCDKNSEGLQGSCVLEGWFDCGCGRLRLNMHLGTMWDLGDLEAARMLQ